MDQHRIVVTGLGAVTPIGIGIPAFWESLLAGRNGVGPVTHFDASGFRAQLAAEVQDFQPEDWIEPKAASRMDRFTHFGFAAASMAIEDSGLQQASYDATRVGVIIGSGIGGSKSIEDGYQSILDKGPRSLPPTFISRLLINMAACNVSIKYGFKGPLSAPSVACSTGANAIGDALRILQRGDADIMIAGSAEACINPLPYGGFCSTRSMSESKDPETACRPFDRNRNGFVMGEGAGIVVLENLEHARARKAPIYAELAGYGNTSDAFHLTAPDPESDGMIRVMQVAIQDAGLTETDVDYINAHGTSTVLNDKSESAAIRKVFDHHSRNLKISSNKSMIGHLMAASGAVELVATVLSVHNQKVPPTIHYTEPDPDCPLDYVTSGAESIKLNAALTNSFGFGGGNASLLVRKWDD